MSRVFIFYVQSISRVAFDMRGKSPRGAYRCTVSHRRERKRDDIFPSVMTYPRRMTASTGDVETAASFVPPKITAAYPESEQEPRMDYGTYAVTRNRLPWDYENKKYIYVVASNDRTPRRAASHQNSSRYRGLSIDLTKIGQYIALESVRTDRTIGLIVTDCN